MTDKKEKKPTKTESFQTILALINKWPGNIDTPIYLSQDNWTDIKGFRVAADLPASHDSDFLAIYEQWAMNWRKDKIRQVVAHRPATLEDFMPLISDDADNYDRDRAAVLHIIWQIKRKMHQYLNDATKSHIGDPMMVNFYSSGTQKKGRLGQGNGKSYFVTDHLLKEIFDPKFDLIFKAQTLSSILDDKWEKQGLNICRSFCTFIDDIGDSKTFVSRAIVDDFKGRISSGFETIRKFNTQRTVTIPNFTTFVSSSNSCIYKLFSDTSGQRRFHQINFKTISSDAKARKQLQRERDAYDWSSLWYSVDPLADSPFDHAAWERKAESDTRHTVCLIKQYLIEDLMASQDWISTSHSHVYEVPAAQIQTNLEIYCQKKGAGRNAYSMKEKKTKLLDYGFTCIRKNSGVVYSVNRSTLDDLLSDGLGLKAQDAAYEEVPLNIYPLRVKYIPPSDDGEIQSNDDEDLSESW
jgi:hypothetical protein